MSCPPAGWPAPAGPKRGALHPALLIPSPPSPLVETKMRKPLTQAVQLLAAVQGLASTPSRVRVEKAVVKKELLSPVG